MLVLQVALLKEERSNLVVENEELYGKVREAETLSRKDSVKAKQAECELEVFNPVIYILILSVLYLYTVLPAQDLKDEFDRLRASHEQTRELLAGLERRVRGEVVGAGPGGQLARLTADTQQLRGELQQLAAQCRQRSAERSGGGRAGDQEVVARLEEQQHIIWELKTMVEFQVIFWLSAFNKDCNNCLCCRAVRAGAGG